VPSPGDWAWSSYRATARQGEPAFLALDRLLPFFGRDEETARLRYRQFVEEGMECAGFGYRPR